MTAIPLPSVGLTEAQMQPSPSVTDPQTGLTLSVELITPAIAQQMLDESNSRNRKLNEGYVTKYATDMTHGHWNLSSNGIGLSQENILLDGQHRLAAIVRSGLPQRMIVVRGLPDAAQTTADTGKARTFADVLTINGYAPSLAEALSRAASWCARYELGALTTNQKRTGNLSFPELADWVNNNLELIPIVEWVQGLDVPSRKGISKTMLMGLIYEAKGLEGEAMEFVQKYSSGVGLEQGSPVLALIKLVDKIHASPTRSASKAYFTGLLIKAFNHYVQGNHISHLRFVYDGNNRKKLKNREKFPTILTRAELDKLNA